MTEPKQGLPLLWDTLRRLAKVVNHVAQVPPDLDEILPNGADFPAISEILETRQGVSLRKFRDCCNELERILTEEERRARKWDMKHGIQ